MQHHEIELFAEACQALGVAANGRKRPQDPANALVGFRSLTRSCPQSCDAWRGLAAAGDQSAHTLAQAFETKARYGDELHTVDVPSGALDFRYDSGLYLEFTAEGADGLALALAAALLRDGKTAGAAHTLEETLTARPGWTPALWGLAVVHHTARRWHDIARVLQPILETAPRDSALHHAARTLYAQAQACLGLHDSSLRALAEPSGPIPSATRDAHLVKGLAARALGDGKTAEESLNAALAADPASETVRAALSDPTYGFPTTTAALIEARTDPWDPATEPTARDHVDPAAAARKADLLAQAEAELEAFIGMGDVKRQVAKLKSTTKVALAREELGLKTGSRSHHLVLKGPPGTGKTAIARVYAKILCGLGVLRRETVLEVDRGKLVGQHIGETESRTNDLIDQALDGVLFVDEAYTLADEATKNDFGKKAVEIILKRMEDNSERLAVLIAGYPAEIDAFLDSNAGLRSRFVHTIEFPSYTPAELVQIATQLAKQRDTILAAPAVTHLESVFEHLALTTTTDTQGRVRKGIDHAGNARFVRTLIQEAESERDLRVDQTMDVQAIAKQEGSAEILMTITLDDIKLASQTLLTR